MLHCNLLSSTTSISLPGSNATESECICWFWLQLTLLLTNSIFLSGHRNFLAISFFCLFSISMFSVFFFIVKLLLTLPFLLSSILTTLRQGMWHWMVWWCESVSLHLPKVSCNFELESNTEWPPYISTYIQKCHPHSHVMVGFAQACPKNNFWASLCAYVAWRLHVAEQHLFAWFKCNLNWLYMLIPASADHEPVHRKSPAISFFSHFSISTHPVFLFIVKLTLPFLLSSILTTEIHVERAWDSEMNMALDGVMMCEH